MPKDAAVSSRDNYHHSSWPFMYDQALAVIAVSVRIGLISVAEVDIVDPSALVC